MTFCRTHSMSFHSASPDSLYHSFRSCKKDELPLFPLSPPSAASCESSLKIHAFRDIPCFDPPSRWSLRLFFLPYPHSCHLISFSFVPPPSRTFFWKHGRRFLSISVVKVSSVRACPLPPPDCSTKPSCDRFLSAHDC